MSASSPRFSSFHKNFNNLESIDEVVDTYRGLMGGVAVEHDARYTAVTDAHRTAFSEIDTNPRTHNVNDVLQTTHDGVHAAFAPTLEQVTNITLAASESIIPKINSEHKWLLKRARTQGRISIGALVDFVKLPDKTREAITIAGDHQTFLRAWKMGNREGMRSDGVGSILTYEASSDIAVQAMRRATDVLVRKDIDSILKDDGLLSQDLSYLLNKIRPTLNSVMRSYLDKGVWTKLNRFKEYIDDPSFADTFTALRRRASTPLVGRVLIQSLTSQKR